MRFSTKQIHAGIEPDPKTGSIVTPIYQTTTYVQPSVDEYLSKGYSYSRTGNPTVRTLERKVAILEGGHDATCFSTGMAGILMPSNCAVRWAWLPVAVTTCSAWTTICFCRI